MQKTIGWLKTHSNLVCEGCRANIKLDTKELARETEKLQKALKSIPKNITIKI